MQLAVPNTYPKTKIIVASVVGLVVAAVAVVCRVLIFAIPIGRISGSRLRCLEDAPLGLVLLAGYALGINA